MPAFGWSTGKRIKDRITVLEDTYERYLWFEEISSGTSGTLTPPAGGTIILDQWAAGVDAVTSTIGGTGQRPSFESVKDASGTLVTASLDGSGNWSLSGTPSAYPMAILYVYDVKLSQADRTKCLQEMETDQGLKKTDSPTFATITLADTIADNTWDTKAVTTKSAQGQLAAKASPLTLSQAVCTTYVGSGSNGISISSNDNLSFGIGDFTLVWKGSLSNWTPTTEAFLLEKYSAGIGFIFYINTAGKINVNLNNTDYLSTTAVDLPNDSVAEIYAVFSRGNTITYFVNGIQLGNAVTCVDLNSVNNTANLVVLGSPVSGGILSKGVCLATAVFNYALSSTQILNLYRNGISYTDKWGSQAHVYDSDFTVDANGFAPVENVVIDGNVDSISGEDNWLRIYADDTYGLHRARHSTVFASNLHKRVRITGKYYIPVCTNVVSFTLNDGLIDWETYSTVGVVTEFNLEVVLTSSAQLIIKINGPGALFTGENSTLDDVVYLKDLVVTQIGATLALEAEGIQADKWYDSSTNNLDASYPSAGWSLVRNTDNPRNFPGGVIAPIIRCTNLTDGYIPKHTSDAIGLENSSILDGELATLFLRNFMFGIDKIAENASDFELTGNNVVSGSGNGGDLIIRAGNGSGAGTNGDLFLEAGQTSSPASITSGGNVYINSGKPSDANPGGFISLGTYTGIPSTLFERLRITEEGILQIISSSAPSSSPADMVQSWVEDVGGAGQAELRVRDELTNVTTLSPHHVEMVTPRDDVPIPWTMYHSNDLLGIEEEVDMAALVKEVELLTGKKFSFTRTINKIKLSDYLAQREQELKKKIIEDLTVEEEISDEETLELKEFDEPTKEIKETKISYEFKDGLKCAKETPVYKTEKVQKLVLKEGVRLCEETGKFFIKKQPSEADIVKELTKKPIDNRPTWLKDRMKVTNSK